MLNSLSFFPRSSLWLILLFVLLEPTALASADEFLIEKTFIFKQPDNTYIYVDSAVFSSDMRQVAYVAVGDKGMQVCVNEICGKTYDHIAKGYPILSPAGNRVGFIADRENKHFVVIDGQEYPGYDGACCLVFSPDGKHSAYIAQDKDKQSVMLNGRRMKPYDMIDRLIGVKFSPDSGKVAYMAKNTSENNVRLVLNGKESPPFDSIDEVLFSLDSKTIAYIVTKDKQQFVFRGDLQEGPFDKAEGLTWSADSSQLAYIIIKNGEFRVVNNGRERYAGDFSPQTVFFEQGGYATRVQQIPPPIFSPDASLMAFTRTEKEKFRVIIGETEGPLFDRVSPVIFSPDSKHHAHIGVSQMLNEKKMQVVYDQSRSPFYDEIDLPVFSPNATRLAYRVRVGDKWFMIVDEKKQKSYDAIGIPCFSPDSGTLAYQATEGNNVLMIVNGKEEACRVLQPVDTPNIITRPCFSPDSRYLAYLVQAKHQECLLVINGDIIESFAAAYPQTLDLPLVFDSESKARFLAAFLKNDRFEAFRIDITIEPQQ